MPVEVSKVNLVFFKKNEKPENAYMITIFNFSKYIILFDYLRDF